MTPSEVEEPQDNELLPVKINFQSSEVTSSTDIIAVQIYYHDSDSKTPYAYGLFDSYDLPSIMLENSTKYSFVITSVLDAQNLIYHTSTSGVDNYYLPFGFSAANPAPLDNSFVVSNNILYAINKGTATITAEEDYEIYTHPQIQRYVGQLNDFYPSVDSVLNIEMRKVYCTLNLAAMNLLSGTLTFEFEGSNSIVLSPDNLEVSVPISLAGNIIDETLWIQDNYSESIEYSVYYRNDSGDKTYFVKDGTLEIVRGATQPITVTVLSSMSFDISFEDDSSYVLDDILIEGNI
ncbi:MAG: hypothetical protein R3Y61_06340 [Rikenellaceae bacterium]